MMNGNGLAALTAPRPPQGMGQPTPAPQQRMPQPRMPQPRPQPPMNQGIAQLMGGTKPTVREQMAIEVVNDDIEPLNLDPKLEAALKLQEAKELVQSANQVLAPNPANMVQQLQQQVPAGIASLSAQMQGRPQMGMQRPSAPRPPMAGGLPQLPSNLPRAAQGGIVAFSAGDKVEKEKSFMDKVRGLFSGQYSADTEGMTPEQYLQYLKNLREERITQGASAEEIQRIEEAIRSFEGTTTAQGMAGGGIVGFNQGLMVRSQERARARDDEEEEERKRAARIAARNNRYAALLADGVPPEEASRMASITEYDPTGEISASISTQPGQEVITTQVDEEEAAYPPRRLMPNEVEEIITNSATNSDRTSELLEQITDVITTPTGDEVIESATATSLGDFAQERLDRDGEELEKERMERARDFYQLSDREKELMMQNRDAIRASYDSRLAPEEVRRLENESLMRILLEPGSVVNAARAKQIEGPAFRERMRQLQEGRVTEPNKVELAMLAQERDALGKVWEAGTKAYERFSAETNQAMQTLAQLETGALNRQTQFLIADRSNQIRALDAQLRAELARVKEANLTEAQERTHRANMARTLSSLYTTTQSTITDLETQAQLGQISPEALADSISVLRQGAARYAEALLDYGDTGEVPELDFGGNVLGGDDGFGEMTVQ